MATAHDELTVSLQRIRRLFASRQVTSRSIEAAGADVSHQGAALLAALLREGRLPMASLATAASKDLAAVSREIRPLEELGAVRRSRSKDDGRVTLVELTAHGKRTAQRLRDVGTRHLQQALTGWSESDMRTLARLLDHLSDDLMQTPLPSLKVA